MNYLPPELIRWGWQPDEEPPKRARSVDMAVQSNEIDQKVIRWVAARLGTPVGKVVDDGVSWIFYDDGGTIIVRLPRDLIERIMEMVWKEPKPRATMGEDEQD